MSQALSEKSVSDIRAAISDASDEDRERVKAEFRAAELERDEPRRTVLDATEPSGPAPPERYTRERLVEGARELFDVSPLLVVGALHESSAETFAIDEAEQLVAAFAEREHGSDEA